ncbi:MAG: hypothetical protein KGJ78_05595 [Alphaproteobacteria bacterium]|nr:hypothetical protein [Alphaproteobacteria bacterium]
MEQLAVQISNCAAELSEAGLAETAELLAIARVDLMVRLHDISEGELDQLAQAASRPRRSARRLSPASMRRRLRGRYVPHC